MDATKCISVTVLIKKVKKSLGEMELLNARYFLDSSLFLFFLPSDSSKFSVRQDYWLVPGQEPSTNARNVVTLPLEYLWGSLLVVTD